jgi:ATP-dependent helicase/nuclease subunit B
MAAMTRPQPVPVPLSASLLEVVADELRARLPGAARGDYSNALVVLPSARACRTLGQLIFEHDGRGAVLLPRILTPAQLALEAGAALDVAPAPDAPADLSRALILTHELIARGWLAGPPEAAPGLAAELVRVFDEIRRHRLADLLLAPRNLDAALARLAVRAAEAEAVATELRSLHEAWRFYRGRVPADHVDAQVALAEKLGAAGGEGADPANAAVPPWPRPGRELTIAAGFTRLDPVTAAPVRAALAGARTALVQVGIDDDPLSRRLAATWDPHDARGGPLGPARRAALLLGVEPAALAAAGLAPPAMTAARGGLRERLDELAATLPPLPAPAAGGPLELWACADAEHEARVIADLVVRRLRAPDGATARVAVAVPDRRLAARVSAQLRDAGLDVDNTHGEPLSAQPAGLLLRFALRAALTGLRGEAVLALLAHPYVQVPVPDGSHGLWTLRLERMLRSDEAFQGGQDTLLRRAREHDTAARAILRRAADGMESFVAAIGDALAPLLATAAHEAAPWAAHLAALRRVWGLLAPGYPLDTQAERADVIAAARLLDELAVDASRLPAVDTATFAADLGRLLAGASAPPHRDPGLGLLVTGHLEARLERFDLLVVGGLVDGALPRRPSRPAFLGGRARETLGLPGRRDGLDADAELFLRLLHGAPRVALTWAAEDEGAPVLPSPLVERLLLVHGLEPRDNALRPPLPAAWRTALPPAAAITAAQAAFLAEPPAAPRLAPARPQSRLSWSALRTWLECPYRFLLERGFALRRDEDVQREFGRREYGSRVHEVMQRFLAPGMPGHEALAAGDEARARDELRRAAAETFAAEAAEQPDRALWHEAFADLVEPVVAHELARFAAWRPLGFELEFALPLADLHAWLRRELGEAAAAADDAAAALLASVPALPPAAVGVVLHGRIDRVDRAHDGSGRLAVLDFKTGTRPGRRALERFEEMQVLLYAVAVAAGAVALPGPAGPAPLPGAVAEGAYYGLKKADEVGTRATPDLPALDGEGRTLLHEGAARLLELALAAAEPDGPFPLVPRALAGEGPAELPCGRCDFRGVCRVEEADLPAPLKRRLEKLVNAREDAW